MAQSENQPTCGKCGAVMTPENARIHPEYFLHDACLPDELRPQPTPPAPLDGPLAKADVCPRCLGELDTGWECNRCGYDARPLVLLEAKTDE